tara:strand:+ start:812 stop:1108 length:297 start_codon:yes stop_codon:yes gene_type:complete
MKPRHEPNYNVDDYLDDRLVAYIEEFDLYINPNAEDRHPVTLVGAKEVGRSNFRCFSIEDNYLIPSRHTFAALHVTPYHMCLLYAACIEHGIITPQGE